MGTKKKEYCGKCNSNKYSIETFCTRCETFTDLRGFYAEKIYPLIIQYSKNINKILLDIFDENDFKSDMTPDTNSNAFNNGFGKGTINHIVPFRNINPSNYKESKELNLDSLFNIAGVKNIILKPYKLDIEVDIYYFLLQTKEGRNIKESMKHDAIFKYDL